MATKNKVTNLPKWTLKKLEKQLMAGATNRIKIANEYNVTHSSVQRFFKGIKKGLTPEVLQEVIQHLEDGTYNRKEIVKKYKLSYSYVSTVTKGVKVAKKNPKNISYKTYEKILEDLQSGEYTQSEVARKYNIPRTTITHYAMRVEVKKRISQKLTNKEIAEINRLYETGDYTFTDLARLYPSVGAPTITRVLKKYKAKKHLTDAQKVEIVKGFHVAGCTREELATKYNVTIATILSITGPGKSKKRKKRKVLSPEEIVELKALLKDKSLTRREISTRFGISERALYRYLDRES